MAVNHNGESDFDHVFDDDATMINSDETVINIFLSPYVARPLSYCFHTDLFPVILMILMIEDSIYETTYSMTDSSVRGIYYRIF